METYMHGLRTFSRIAFLTSMLLCFLCIQARGGETPRQVIRLHAMPIQGMVMLHDKNMTGFYVDTWSAIMHRAGYHSIIYLEHTREDLLHSLRQGRADAIIGDFGMDPKYLDILTYSYPVINTGLQIMVPTGASNMVSQVFKDALDMLASPYILTVLGFCILAAITAGHIIWLTERQSNPEFPTAYLPGVATGVWWAIVTLSSVGYGDKVPRTKFGRFTGVLFILLGSCLMAGFISTFTARLTLNHIGSGITTLTDLSGRAVSTLDNPEVLALLKKRKIDVFPEENVEAAARLMLNGTVEAVVMQEEELQRFMTRRGGGRFKLVGNLFDKTSIAVCFPRQSPYLSAVNRAILEIKADGTYDAIYSRWFSTPPGSD